MKTENTFKVLLVDDNPVFSRSALAVIRAMFAAAPRTLVLEAAGSGAEALDKIDLDRPDLVLMDLHMPEMNGIEATRRIKSANYPTKVVMMSLCDNDELSLATELAKADAFFNKLSLTEQLPELMCSAFEAVTQ